MTPTKIAYHALCIQVQIAVSALSLWESEHGASKWLCVVTVITAAVGILLSLHALRTADKRVTITIRGKRP